MTGVRVIPKGLHWYYDATGRCSSGGVIVDTGDWCWVDENGLDSYDLSRLSDEELVRLGDAAGSS